MTATTQSHHWDFSHVLDLVNSLSFQQGTLAGQHTDNGDKDEPTRSGLDEEGGSDIESRDFATRKAALGDFSKIFQYLGTPVNSPAPAVQPAQPNRPAESAPQYFTTKTDYASDGAAPFIPASAWKRNVRWQNLSDTEEQGGETVSDSSIIPESPTLTKSQRKKKNRRERRAKEAAEAEVLPKRVAAAYSESEADIVPRKAPAKKASSHAVNATPTKVYSLRERDASGKVVTPSGPDPLLAAAKTAREALESAKQNNKNAFTQQKENVPNGGTLHTRGTPARHNSQPVVPLAQPARPTKPAAVASQHPPSTPSGHVSDPATLQFVPATVGPHHKTQQKQIVPPSHAVAPASLPPKKPSFIQPMIVRSGEDRHWALLMKLIGEFYEDRKYLVSPMNLTTHNNDPNGIHVFVDASNIFIGFNDQLKRSRGIPPWTQLPHADMSFDALALLMERRRPVAKRVLAGSTPWQPAFDKAKAVGYECSILEKVHKARELTERQIFFKEHDRYGVRWRAKAPASNNVALVNGGGSGSETTAPQYAPAKMIEQGVDEILHLKILESVVDAETPSTIVLATGDAAQAEYSEGFMAMAERALRKGWRVELVSWSRNISAGYTRKGWREQWGERFRVVTLDDYAEELLDM
ncbi:uncharacterized protein LTR77_006075 [Saxophila tyrrhenica]|uniref:NYN domain-containing protein n=1 Tax=Saxophila tyrrhenica TaxID=1690608 RepID=A0AAV9P6V2_9PEZI|nr:hypothetical protein LTR77_006075 [Saxophila tyrrhenica]